jgi:hypothetical protein
MPPADPWIVPTKPWEAQDDVELVIKVEYDEVIIVLLAVERVVKAHYTLHNLHRCAGRKAHGHPRRRDLTLDVLEREILQGLPSNKVVRRSTIDESPQVVSCDLGFQGDEDLIITRCGKAQ